MILWFLKPWVIEFTKRLVSALGAVGGPSAHTNDGPLESIVDCSQQHSKSLDYAIVGCFIMRQYANKSGIDSSINGMTPTAFRATLVKHFVNDPKRGLRSRPI
ncbi:hypothetical protein CsSME_00028320 [Camellia sinensis var. sinensis]